ncbi:MAG: CDP-alcohol phosphatidyltransferase family protein [Nocardioidaceae bacterium]
MQPDTEPESSREATNRLLLDLKAGRWRTGAWAQFLAAATARSVGQAVAHRRAFAQATALHVVFLTIGRGGGRRWVATSWALTGLHLGMLEDRSDLGAANTLTLVRANLPVTGRPLHSQALHSQALGSWLGAAAGALDFVDGKLARHSGTTTPFGRYADPLADAAFWAWLTSSDSGQGGRAAQVAVALTWLAPTVVVTAASFRRGEMVESPRPRWVRPAATLQILLAARALHRRLIGPRTRALDDGVRRLWLSSLCGRPASRR